MSRHLPVASATKSVPYLDFTAAPNVAHGMGHSASASAQACRSLRVCRRVLMRFSDTATASRCPGKRYRRAEQRDRALTDAVSAWDRGGN